MNHSNEAFGIMDEAYFVPRSEILSWVNNLLKIEVPKIEAFGAGNVYCQIMDVIFPEKVAMSKINWKARMDYQFISNLKILQNAFDRLGVKKYIDIEKIARAKYQDNLQLIQWFKRYYDVNCGGRGENYPAQQRRGFVVPDFSFSQKVVIPKTYNGSGQCTYNVGSIKPTKKQSQNQPINKKATIYSQNQNSNWTTKQQAPINDQRINTIRGILDNSNISAEQKLNQINGIVN